MSKKVRPGLCPTALTATMVPASTMASRRSFSAGSKLVCRASSSVFTIGYFVDSCLIASLISLRFLGRNSAEKTIFLRGLPPLRPRCLACGAKGTWNGEGAQKMRSQTSAIRIRCCIDVSCAAGELHMRPSGSCSCAVGLAVATHA